jgi:hypothetical protein
MLTPKDIIKLSKVLATKEDINELKTTVTKISETVNSSTASTDNLAKKVDTTSTENIIIKSA